MLYVSLINDILSINKITRYKSKYHTSTEKVEFHHEKWNIKYILNRLGYQYVLMAANKD